MFIRQFIPQTIQNRAAIRTALATLIAVLIAFYFHLEKPYWSGMTVVIVANVYTGNIIDKALMRLLGAVIGAWLGYFLAGFIANSFLLYLLISFFIVAFAVYYYNFSRYGYAYILGALSAFIVIAEIPINPNEAFSIAIWRPVEIGVGVIVSAVSAFTIFPNTVKETLTKDAEEIFKATYRLFEELEGLLINSSENSENFRNDLLKSRKTITNAMDKLVFMSREFSNYQALAQFRFFLTMMYRLNRLINYYIFSINGVILNNEKISFSAFFAAVKHDLPLIEKSFFEPPLLVSLTLPAVIKQIDDELGQLIYENNEKNKENYLLISYFLRQISTILLKINHVIILKENPETSKKLITYQQQLRKDPEIIIHGIKAGLAAVLSLLFWLISNWPGGLSGIVSSIVLSMRRNLYEMGNRGIHRLIGCILGGGIILSLLAIFSYDIYLLIITILFFVWAFSLFSFYYENYSYIGLQANIALIIAIAQESGPPVTLDAPLERLGGVVIGIIASLLVANIIWRTDLLNMLARQLRSIDRLLILNYRKLFSGERDTIYYEISPFLWISRGLLETLEKLNLSKRKKAQLEKIKLAHATTVKVHVILNNLQENVDRALAVETATLLNYDLSSLSKDFLELLFEPEVSDKIQHSIQSLYTTIFSHNQIAEVPINQLENLFAYLQSLDQLTYYVPRLVLIKRQQL